MVIQGEDNESDINIHRGEQNVDDEPEFEDDDDQEGQDMIQIQNQEGDEEYDEDN